MSTIVVTKMNGVVAIGADTLTKHGYTKQHASLIANHTKITRIGESYLAATGDASWILVLSHYLARRKGVPRLDSPAAIFDFARSFHKELKEDYFLNPREDEKDSFESSQLDCLIANPAGIFGLYSLRSVDEFTKFYAFGAECRFALGAMHAAHPGAKSAEDLARAGLEAAAEFDDETGAPFELHAFKLRGGDVT